MPRERRRFGPAFRPFSMAPAPTGLWVRPEAGNSRRVPLSNAIPRPAHHRALWPLAGTELDLSNPSRDLSNIPWVDSKRLRSPAFHRASAAPAPIGPVFRQRYAESCSAELWPTKVAQTAARTEQTKPAAWQQ